METQARSHASRAVVAMGITLLIAALAACDGAIPSPTAAPTRDDGPQPSPTVTLEPQSTQAPDDLRDEGLALLRAGDLTAAAEAFEAALAVAPDDAGIHYHLGLLRMEQEDFSAAVGALMRAVDLDPGNAEAFLTLGEAHLKLGNAEAAEVALAEARDLDPTNPRVYYYLGLAYREQGAYGQAIETFEQYLSMVPDEAPDQDSAAAAVEELRADVTGEWVSITNDVGGFGLQHPQSWVTIAEGSSLILTEGGDDLGSGAATAPTVVFQMWSADELQKDLGLAALDDPADVVRTAAESLGVPAGEVQTAALDGYPAALIDVTAEVRGIRYYGTLAIVFLEDRVLRVDGAGPANRWPEVRPLCIDMINSLTFAD